MTQASGAAATQVAIIFFTSDGKQAAPLYVPWARVESSAGGVPMLIAGTADPQKPQTRLALYSGFDGWQISSGWRETGRRFPSFVIVAAASADGAAS